MQRKNNILKPRRNGFAMIMAIIVIVILMTVMALTISLTSQTTKQTGDLYLREQAVLLAKSAAELALLEISGHSRGTTNPINCLGEVNATYPSTNPIFAINVKMRYIGFDCSDNTLEYGAPADLKTAESNGTVLMDISVESNASTEPIRYFRRTLQKL